MRATSACCFSKPAAAAASRPVTSENGSAPSCDCCVGSSMLSTWPRVRVTIQKKVRSGRVRAVLLQKLSRSVLHFLSRKNAFCDRHFEFSFSLNHQLLLRAAAQQRRVPRVPHSRKRVFDTLMLSSCSFPPSSSRIPTFRPRYFQGAQLSFARRSI